MKKTRIFYMVFVLTVLFASMCFARQAIARQISEQDVRIAVASWLQLPSEHFEENLGNNIKQVELFRGGVSGNIGYYLVILEPAGWMILPADNRFWPVQMFGSGIMTIENFKSSVWYRAIHFSDSSFIENHSAFSANIRTEIPSPNQDFWTMLKTPLTRGRVGNDDRLTDLGENSDIRVPSFLSSSRRWGQMTPFNKFTNFHNLVGENEQYRGLSNIIYPAGCVPLATAQVMHHLLTSGLLDNSVARQKMLQLTHAFGLDASIGLKFQEKCFLGNLRMSSKITHYHS